MKRNFKLKRLAFSVIFSTFYFSLFTSRVSAMCPVCTIAVASTVILLERYGVDNTISGLWIGGLLISSSIWFINWLEKKKWAFPFFEPLVYIIFYSSLIIPFHHRLIIGNPFKMLWGMDKVLLGMSLGSITFFLFGFWYQKIKEKNGGHAWFPFQRVVWPIMPLIILSFIFYFLTKGN